ncbi:MAG: hypothetical protein MAG458_00630 [Nitrosopumilus sp.]|nr:hypothetical protein [Nitrosopumilus sp.]
MDSPNLSYCGLPALPQSCLYSKILIGLFAPTFALYLFTFEITTRLAGRFTPAARVGVEDNNLIVPLRNSFSIISLHF